VFNCAVIFELIEEWKKLSIIGALSIKGIRKLLFLKTFLSIKI
jgi:hypothetical protein